MQPPLMIEAGGLTKSFGAARVVTGLDMGVPAGAALCLLGPNGAGKTTIVRMLTTLLRPDAGWARWPATTWWRAAPRYAGTSACPARTHRLMSA